MKLWKALGDLSLLQWIYTSIPGLAGVVMGVLLSMEKELLVQILLATLAISLFLLAFFIKVCWPSSTPQAPTSPSVARTGIVATGSTIKISNGRIKAQDISVDLTNSALNAKNLDIE